MGNLYAQGNPALRLLLAQLGTSKATKVLISEKSSAPGPETREEELPQCVDTPGPHQSHKPFPKHLLQPPL